MNFARVNLTDARAVPSHAQAVLGGVLVAPGLPRRRFLRTANLSAQAKGGPFGPRLGVVSRLASGHSAGPR